MNLLSYRNRTKTVVLDEPATMDEGEIDEMAELVDRFNRAHARLNEVELALHENMDSDRLALLHRLEDARGAYMDARYALSIRTTH
jgi:hypothetical protein